MKMKTLALGCVGAFLGGICAAGVENGFYKYTNYNPDLPENKPSAADFASPQGYAKPQTWWHWLNGNVSRQGIENDLKEMSDKGYGLARIFHIADKIEGPITFNSPEWFETFTFANETAKKYGMELGIHNCDGWSEAGGPWITPAESMKELTWTLTRLQGDGKELTISLPKPVTKEKYYEEIGVWAWPAKRPSVLAMGKAGFKAYASTPYNNAKEADLPKLFDGARKAFIPVSYEKSADKTQYCGVTVEFEKPFEAAGAFMEIAWMYELPINIFLETSDDGKTFEKVCEVKFKQGDAQINFAPRKAKFWRIVRYQSKIPSERVNRGVVKEHELALSEFELLAPNETSRSGSCIDNLYGKAGIVEKGGLAQESDYDIDPKLILKPEEVQNLSGKTAQDGTLKWTVPQGEWVIMRAGFTTTGKTVHPATKGGKGLEVDKFEPAFVEHHFNSYDKKMIEAAGPLAGNVFTVIETDSWEAGHQNWTQKFPEYFKAQNGYDIFSWMPVFAGECMVSVQTTENFLRDLRGTFSKLIMDNFYGTMARMTHKYGLKYETEGASGVYMRNTMNSFREADYPMTEVWQEPRRAGVVDNVRKMRIYEVFSTANFYGKKYVTCEALTSRKGNWAETPWVMKGTADTLLMAGTNIAVFHSYTHQPDETYPGWQMNPWGVSQNRKTVWWPISKDWFSYIGRNQYMLQKGKYEAKILYLFSDEVPSGQTGFGLNGNYNYDIIEGDGVRNFLRVEGGLLTSPGKMKYGVLVISPNTTIKLETLEKMKEYLEAGATLAAYAKPAFCPSLRGGKAADKEWTKLADELYGDGKKSVRKIGKGKFYVAYTPDEVVAALGIKEDFVCELTKGSSDDILYMRRGFDDGSEWFWVLNSDSKNAKNGVMSFDVTGKGVAIWYPETGKTEKAPAYVEKDGRTVLPLNLKQMEGVFVVFDGKPAANAVTKVSVNGTELYPDLPKSEQIDNTKISENFTMIFSASPSAERKLSDAKSSGIISQSNENFALYPEQMHIKMSDNNRACAGVSVGQNSVAVFEHGAGFFNSVLVYDEAVPENARIAVVYADNVPSLYINGKFVAKAQKSSNRKVHPADSLRLSFNGQAWNYALKPAILNPTEIAADFKSAAVSPSSLPQAPHLFADANGKIGAEFFAQGAVSIVSEGKESVLKADKVKPAFEINAPFAVTFDTKFRGPEGEQTFDALKSWTESANPAIKHYSGLAKYSKRLKLSKADLPANSKIYLEIDKVGEVAELRINGERVGTMWRPPYSLEVTNFLKEGDNTIEIVVGNTWVNRCLYEAGMPKQDRLTWANTMDVHYPDLSKTKASDYFPWRDGPLPSGLIGGMRLKYSSIVMQ